MADVPLLSAEGLSKHFRYRVGLSRAMTTIEAVHDVSFSLRANGVLAIIGESGSGKTTIARMVAGLEVPSAGVLRFDGRVLAPRPAARERRARASLIQIVFQDPYLSLDPHQTPASAIDEVLAFRGVGPAAPRRARVGELLAAVGLGEREARALPRELSGGQCQRVAIARALAAEARLLVLDEAVSALDVSVQAQILNLLLDLRDRLGLALLFISHNLAVVRQLADDVLVLYRGRTVEYGPIDRVLSEPRDPYTRRLLASVPRPASIGTPSPAPAIG